MDYVNFYVYLFILCQLQGGLQEHSKQELFQIIF